MTILKSLEFSIWLLIILIPVLIIIILGLFYWYFTHRRQKKKLINNLSSSINNIPKKSLSISSSQLTNTDIAYLDKLIRSASDRSLLKRDNLTKKEQFNKLRKVPSRQIQEKT